MKLEKICIHKGKGCSNEKICDGQGKYYENQKTKYCKREVFDEIGLWRTAYMTVYE